MPFEFILAVIGVWTLCSLLNLLIYDTLMAYRDYPRTFDGERREFVLMGPGSLIYWFILTAFLLAAIAAIVIYDKICSRLKTDPS